MSAPVDFRSDTVTRPTAAMWDAMRAAELGDDVFGDDPTVNALQERVATLLGKERALFVPSGTMANQLAVRAQTQPGDEVVLHHKAHIFNYEGGGASALAGVQLRPIDSPDGTLPVDIEPHLHLSDDPHFAPTSLLCFEDTNNGCGGVVVPPENIAEVTRRARAAAEQAGKTMRFHLDGARLFNAHVASGRPLRDMAAPFDTISVCMSKALGAPLGSVLAGDAATIGRAYRFRKMYGGGMRQAGVVAAAGLFALEHHVAGLADDHRRATALATALDALPSTSVALDRVHTNLVYFDLDPAHAMAQLDDAGQPRLVRALAERGILITGSATRYRAVTHLNVNDAGIDRAIDAFRTALS